MKEPKIRFKGFSGEWKECTLSNIITVNSGKDYKHLEKGTIPVYGTGGYMLSVNTSLSEHDAIGIGRKGTIDKPQYLKAPFWTVDTLFFLTTNNGDNLDFLFNLSQNIRWQKYDESTGVPSLSKNNIDKIKTCIPNKFEQQSVASFFTSLDAQISASTSRLASLKQMKAASLQAMFPQEGETVPKVRFKGFEGEWKKQSASDLFLSIDERNRPELPVLSACQDIRGMIPREKIGFNVSHDTSNEVTYKRVKPGQFVIHLRSFQGGFAHSSYDGIISPAYTVFDFKDKERHDDYYWKIVFMSRAFIDRLRLITYGIRDGRSINFDEFKDLSFLFPSKEEQHAIATFFRSLDRQIALHTQRLEKLKQIKAACLDKMFV